MSGRREEEGRGAKGEEERRRGEHAEEGEEGSRLEVGRRERADEAEKGRPEDGRTPAPTLDLEPSPSTSPGQHSMRGTTSLGFSFGHAASAWTVARFRATVSHLMRKRGGTEDEGD